MFRFTILCLEEKQDFEKRIYAWLKQNNLSDNQIENFVSKPTLCFKSSKGCRWINFIHKAKKT